MKVFSGLTLFAAVQGCSTTCGCPSGFSPKNGPEGTICYKRYITAKKYENAKAHCQKMDMYLPRINSDAELEFYTSVSSGSTWVQAEKRKGNPGTLLKWRDWKGNILQNQEWYNDPEEKDKDEPSKDDVWGYIKAGSVWGATQNATRAYVCELNIQDCIDDQLKNM
ncbi:unnamed protein product [Oikopleura dioica]|uniref:C-type lectin domain-containing protein n=1 Tax=Oikopleura dioica TaxID=34765 RepID=E4Y448_OIKDI|nr:unnamed protein product [Oikopleura dioica]